MEDSRKVDQISSKIWKIMIGYAEGRVQKLNTENKQVAHYTTAETALQIIDGRTMWLRNAAVMNDHSEIEYGKNIVGPALNGKLGERFCSVLNTAHNGIAGRVIQHYEQSQLTARETMFMTALCEHSPTDRLGRLSMWRAYGGSAAGVALVFDRTVVTEASSTQLSLNASPVLYADRTIFDEQFLELIERLEANLGLLKSVSAEIFTNMAAWALKFAMLSIKHPGFSEEQEWRLLHLPYESSSAHVIPSVRCIRGIPQTIYEIPFHNPSKGALFNLPLSDLNHLLKCVIIGPCLHPNTVRRAFEEKMKEAGISNASNRVFVSDIPLRQWS